MDERKTIWEQIVDQKEKYIGKTLVDTDLGLYEETEIIDITFKPNGNSYYFMIEGKDFSCGFDITAGGISGMPEIGAIFTFQPIYSGAFYIK